MSGAAGPRRRKVIWTRLGILLLAALLALPVVMFYFIDSPPPDDADLLPPASSVPDAENGLVAFVAAAGGIVWPEEPVEEGEEAGGDGDEMQLTPEDRLEEYAHGRGWDAALVRQALESNRAVLDGLDAAMRMERFAPPPIRVVARWPLWDIGAIRTASTLLTLRARAKQESGEHRAALERAFELVRLGRRLEACGGTATDYVVANAVTESAQHDMIRIVASAPLTRAEVLWALGEAERIAPALESLRASLRGEYAFWAFIAESVERGDPIALGSDSTPIWPWRSRSFFLQQHSKTLLVDVMREVLGILDEPEPWRVAPWEDYFAIAPNRWIPGRNGIGRSVVVWAVKAFQLAVKTYQSARFHHECFRSILALKGRLLVHGTLPERLDELVPEWLPAVPLDPLDGQPLRYDAKRRLLWSVGGENTELPFE